MKKMWKYLLFLPLLAFMVSCGDDDDAPVTPEPEPPTLSEALAATDALGTLEDAVTAITGLAADLEGRDAITVFAPNNAAFTATLAVYGVSDLNGLIDAIGGEATLEVLLQYHVVEGAVLSSQLTNGQMIETLTGDMLEVTINGGTVSITDQADRTFNVVTADVEIANGVVHIINGVLIPDPELLPSTSPTIVQALQNTPTLSSLNTAVGVVDGLSQTLLDAEAITVFAPNDEAFAELLGERSLSELVTELGGPAKLAEVLNFHVVEGANFAADLTNGQVIPTINGQNLNVSITADGVFINGNLVSGPDVEIANGVVHVIDGVLLPELEYPTISGAIGATPALETLGSAVGLFEGLGAALEGYDDITIFAPTNDAFQKLLDEYGAADLAELSEKVGGDEVIQTVLQYHVVENARVFSHDLTDGQVVETLAGANLTVGVSEAGVTLTDVDGITYNVTTADVRVDNGVVHIIDGVLLPIDRPTLVEAATAAELDSLLVAVTAVPDLAGTLLGAEAITVFAPTNEAFENALTAFEVETLAELIDALGGVEALGTVLGFHVVPAVAYASDLEEGPNTFTTLANQEITVTKTGGAVTVSDGTNPARAVEMADVTIENGVVHVIDGVLVPDLE